jgi:hypothetical protein
MKVSPVGEVVEMPKRWTAETVRIFACACGGETFWAMASGDMVCTDCRHICTAMQCSAKPGHVLPQA